MPKSEASGNNRTVRIPPERQRRVKPDRTTESDPAAGMEGPSSHPDDLLQSDFSQRTFERHAALLADPRLSRRMYASQRSAIVMQLQRDYGNRYVQRLVKHNSLKVADAVQTKLKVGPAGDKFEQEADRVAKHVMSSIASSGPETAQRQEEEEEELQMMPVLQRQEEEEELQMQPVLQRQEEEEELQMQPVLQRQEEEEEELQMQPVLQRQEEEELQMQPVLQRQEEEEELQMMPVLQRQEEEEEELQMKPVLQRQEEEEEELQMKPVPQRQEEEEELQMMPVLQRQEEEEELQMMPVAQRQEEEEELQMMPVLQRQEEEEELQMKPVPQRQEEEELQMKPVAQRQEEEEELQMKPVAQRQEEEEELQMKPVAQRQEEEEELQMKPVAQRQEEEEELQMKTVTQRRVGLEGGDLEPGVEQTIHAAGGGGQPLPANLRRSMEGAFGGDFSGVKVHTGVESDSLNDSLSSRAFTTGRNIFFRQGDYTPESSSGKELIAHELTHVVQQNGSGAKPARRKTTVDRARSDDARQSGIQRMLMTDEQWKKTSHLRGGRRSPGMLKIGSALARYNEAHSATPEIRLDLLKTLSQTINDWRKDKPTSKRADAIKGLSARIGYEFDFLTKLADPKTAGQISPAVHELYQRGVLIKCINCIRFWQ